MELSDVIQTRHSVRKFKDEPVPDDKINQILESGRLAPSWANKQGWRFVVAKSQNARDKVIKAAAIYNRWLKGAQVIIVACGDPKASGSRNGIDYIAVDVAIAMEHMVLTAHDLGLGTCWVGAYDEDGIKEALGIPGKNKVIAIMPLGYPKDKETMIEKTTKAMIGSKKRKPLEEIVCFDSWKF